MNNRKLLGVGAVICIVRFFVIALGIDNASGITIKNVFLSVVSWLLACLFTYMGNRALSSESNKWSKSRWLF